MVEATTRALDICAQMNIGIMFVGVAWEDIAFRALNFDDTYDSKHYVWRLVGGSHHRG
jgi:hypothetical protein